MDEANTVTAVKPEYTYTPTGERFTRITWSPENKEPAVTVYSNFGVAAKFTGKSAIIFTDLLGMALTSIQEQERIEREAKRNPPVEEKPE